MKIKSAAMVGYLAAMTALSAPALMGDTPGAPHARPPLDPHTVPTLIKLGEDAFNANDMLAARDAFADAFSADSSNVIAARDLAIVYLRLEKPAKAAHPLEVAMGAKSLDRGLVLALATQRIATHQPMQAVKFITTYFEAHPSPPDEPLLDAMGIALAQAEAAGVKSSLFTDAGKAYKKLNTKLEATRAGEKRWGPEWFPAADVDAKLSALNTAQATSLRDTVQLRKLDAQIAEIQRQKDAVLYTEGDNNQTQKKDALQKQIDAMNTDRTPLQKELDEAEKTLADLKARWPDEFPVEELSLASTATVELAHATLAPPSTPPDPTPAPTPGTPAANPAVTPAAAPDATPEAKPVIQPYHGTHFAAAFAIAPDLLVTASSAVADATDIEIPTTAGVPMKAEIVRADAPSGLTLLRVTGAHFAPLPIAAAAKTGPIKCETFPEVELFGPVPKELSGALSLSGEHPTTTLDKLPRIPGGPLLQDGKVAGVEMGDRDSDRQSVPVVTLELLQPLLASDATGKAVVTDMKNSVFQIAASK